MRPVLSLLVFVGLSAASFLIGFHSYSVAQQQIVADLNQALAKTLSEKGQLIARADTIRACRLLETNAGGDVAVSVADETLRRNLTLDALREKAYIAFSFRRDELPSSELRTDTFRVATSADHPLSLCGYAPLSFGVVWSLSDQRAAALLGLLAFGWLALSLCRFRRSHDEASLVPAVAQLAADAWGGIVYQADAHRFVSTSGEVVRLTPMQQRLLEMFYAAPDHRLSHTEICTTLWPRKPDASDTLYALLSRLKRTLRPVSTLRIEVDRTRGYEMRESDKD